MVQAAEESNFEKLISQGVAPVVVDFWAPWCKPCLALSPLLEELEAVMERKFQLIKVNVDECTSLAQRFNVRSLPTLVILLGGETVARKVGASTRSALEEWISTSISGD